MNETANKNQIIYASLNSLNALCKDFSQKEINSLIDEQVQTHSNPVNDITLSDKNEIEKKRFFILFFIFA